MVSIICLNPAYLTRLFGCPSMWMGSLLLQVLPLIRKLEQVANGVMLALWSHSADIILQLNASTVLCFNTMLPSRISSEMSGDVSVFCGTVCTAFLRKSTARCLSVIGRLSSVSLTQATHMWAPGAQRLIFWQPYWFFFWQIAFWIRFGCVVGWSSDSGIDFLITYQLIYICQLPKQTNEIWPKSPWCKRNCY